MSRLDELLKQYCPNGVEYKPLWSVTAWDKKFQGVEKEKQAKVIDYAVLLANDLFALQQDEGDVFLLSTGSETGWTTEELAGDNLREGEVVSIPWGKAGTVNVKTVIKYYKGKFVTGDNRIMTSLDTNVLNNRFLYHVIVGPNGIDNTFYRGSGIRHPDMRRVLDLVIPVPPLAVQEEIVKILDNYTEQVMDIKKELEAELLLRKQQYEYYRDVAFDDVIDDSEWFQIREVCKRVCSGGTPKTGHDEYYGGDIPWLRTQEVDWTDIYDTGIKISEDGLANSSAKWIAPNCVIVAMYGATAAKVAINKIPLTTNQACCNLEIDEHKARYRYVYHWLCSQYETLKSKGQGSQNNINADIVKSYLIPVPSLEKQDEIISILDRFDALCTDISSGLPAEITARQKQYEYYRDKLLSFEVIT